MASKESESGPHVPKLELGGDERASERQVRASICCHGFKPVALSAALLCAVLIPNVAQVLLFRAKLYEQTERYDSMLLTAFQVHAWCCANSCLCGADPLLSHTQLADAVTGEMSTEEQHVVTVAFKNAVSPLRTSWRILSAKEGRDHESKSVCLTSQLVCNVVSHVVLHPSRMEFRNEEVVPELKALLHRILACVRRLHKTASSPQASAFLLKLEGDYLRFVLVHGVAWSGLV